MTLIDTHAHLDFYPKSKIPSIIKRAKQKRVKIILSNGVNPSSNRKTLNLSKRFPEIKACLGLYPVDALSLSDKEFEQELEFIKKNKNKISAIGEIGIDLKEATKLKKQEKNFIKLINLSKELNKPIIIHSRKAEEKVIEILEKLKHKKVIMHCFSGKLKLVKRIIKNSWLLSIPTSVKNAEHFQKVIEIAPIENLLCETDSPFLHPDKKPNNEPANVIESYKKIAEIKNLSLKEVEKRIYENYKLVFG